MTISLVKTKAYENNVRWRPKKTKPNKANFHKVKINAKLNLKGDSDM